MRGLLVAVAGCLALAVSGEGFLPLVAAQQGSRVTGQSNIPLGRDGTLPGTMPADAEQALLRRYCVGCHNQRMSSGNLVLDGLDPDHAGDRAEIWERVVRKLRGGLMPPVGSPRPDEVTYNRFLSTLQDRLDKAAAVRPDPGRTELAHRLNRTEYGNAVRDLLLVDINAADLLPADDSSYGFDNIAGVLKMSPSLMERYLAAAKVVSRTAIGSPPPSIGIVTYRVSHEAQQQDRDEQLPFGTRGGTLIHYVFPVNADYDIEVSLTNGETPDLSDLLEITIDGAQAKLFTLESRSQPRVRLSVSGGAHDVGVAFYRKSLDLVEQVREPFQNPAAPSGTGGLAGPVPAVASVTISGPYNSRGSGETSSRRRLFVCYPGEVSQEAPCAKTVLSTLARRAYRGLSTPESVHVLVDFYEKGRADGGSFEDGVEFALRRLLVSPEFLYRIEGDAATRTAARSGPSESAAPAGVHRIGHFELASRLSFFLWSSIPDDELLDLAAEGTLANPIVLERQVRRMLADPRSETLAKNFGGQWLLIRNVAIATPGEVYALNFDETLRHAMQRETELFLDSFVRENRNVIELLTANYTFVNERLAAHYGIPNIQGSHFRRVVLPANSPRRGLLGQGSILTVTSPSIRTSPVIRGKWILNNILGSPPPDPPPNVPALSDKKTQARVRTMRERMSQHRASAVCASCHNMIDPAGFALENFDAVGKWRVVDESFNPIDASGALPDGTTFNGVSELRMALASHPERFVHTMTEKLLTYALGRGLEYSDMPAVRKILRETASDSYRMPSIILGIVRSYPFQFRRADAAAELQASGRLP